MPRRSPDGAPPTSASAPRPCSQQAPWPPSRMSALCAQARRWASKPPSVVSPGGTAADRAPQLCGCSAANAAARVPSTARTRPARATHRGWRRAGEQHRSGRLGGEPRRGTAPRAAPPKKMQKRSSLRSPRALVALYRRSAPAAPRPSGHASTGGPTWRNDRPSQRTLRCNAAHALTGSRSAWPRHTRRGHDGPERRRAPAAARPRAP